MIFLQYREIIFLVGPILNYWIGLHNLRGLFLPNDDDFLVEATKRQRKEQLFYGLIYAHHLKVSIGNCIKELELLAKSGEVDEIKNQVIFLPLKTLL